MPRSDATLQIEFSSSVIFISSTRRRLIASLRGTASSFGNVRDIVTSEHRRERRADLALLEQHRPGSANARWGRSHLHVSLVTRSVLMLHTSFVSRRENR